MDEGRRRHVVSRVGVRRGRQALQAWASARCSHLIWQHRVQELRSAAGRRLRRRRRRPARRQHRQLSARGSYLALVNSALSNCYVGQQAVLPLLACGKEAAARLGLVRLCTCSRGL